MSLTFCSDVSPANWIVDSALPWQRLVGFGPSGFAEYARLRYLPDPACEGQSENDADVDAWCVASDVDPHWAGIGADTHVIEQLVSDARLDVVCADPDAEQHI